MATGTLIAESLRPGTALADLDLTVHEIRRVETELGPEQRAAGLPELWTLIEFEVADERAGGFAEVLSTALDEPGWYADFHADDRSWVVFAGRVFAYQRGDADGRAEAEAHARASGVPDAQLDWP